MIPQISPANIIAADLPDYYDECVKEGVTPLIGRAEGWQEITSANDLTNVEVTVKNEYGSKDILIPPSTVVTVAVYAKTAVVT